MSVTNLFSYKIRRDYGFAPNPYFGYCTVACCKPRIRRAAQVDDWVVGGGSAQNNLRHKVVFAMRVTETMTFDDYWNNCRFQLKKPNFQNSCKYAFGDNIYHEVVEGQSATQSNSHHSYSDGSTNYNNLTRDIGANRVLISDDFVYFGSKAIKPPEKLANWGGYLFPTDCRDFQRNYPQEMIDEIILWLRSLCVWGVVGRPEAWKKPYR